MWTICVMDGWGLNPNTDGNAIRLAKTPAFDYLCQQFPMSVLEASGEAVGLPCGQMGNSEVGHLNIGAGRIVYQDLTRIDKEIREGAFFQNPALKSAFAHAKNNGTRLHLIGLTSQGGVHSSQNHLHALIDMAVREGVRDVWVHAITDGRDSSPTGGVGFVRDLQAVMRTHGVGRIASVSGRYYAMDRDRRWERTHLAYLAIHDGEGPKADDPVAYLERSYAEGVTDEFVIPAVIDRSGHVQDNDAIIFFNFRPDRAVQLTQALISDSFDDFPRAHFRKPYLVSMGLYLKEFNIPVAYPPQTLKHILPEVVSQLGWRQFRTAETEKYRHVTSFFNGGQLAEFPGEERELVPSPKVATYDLMPEMSAEGVTGVAKRIIRSGAYQMLVMNYANADMVGHSGNIPAAVRAVETVDHGVGEIWKAVQETGGYLLLTADHGNAEQMIDPTTGGPHTAHTTNPVPFLLCGPKVPRLKEKGILGDIAPTLLELAGIHQPAEMTGKSLLLQ